MVSQAKSGLLAKHITKYHVENGFSVKKSQILGGWIFIAAVTVIISNNKV
jgi:hypothetical protein